MLRVGILVSGGGTNLQAILDAVQNKVIVHAEISVVISNNPSAYALERARLADIDALCVSPKDFSDRTMFYEALLKTLKDYQLDLIVLAGYLVKIPPSIVESFEKRIINIHPSLIPSFCGEGYYGIGVHEAALARGVKLTGATVHYVDTGMDTGEILLQKSVEVKIGDTPEILQRRVMEEAEWILLPQAIEMIASGGEK